MLGEKTFILQEDVKVFSFCNANEELEICDGMKFLFNEDSSKSIFDLKVEHLNKGHSKNVSHCQTE